MVLELGSYSDPVPEKRKEQEGLKEQLLKRREQLEKLKEQLSAEVGEMEFISGVQNSSGVFLFFKWQS